VWSGNSFGGADQLFDRDRSNKQSGEDGNGNSIELEITNAPLGLCSSALAAPFSERALYPKA
jgi:hypothetical protein